MTRFFFSSLLLVAFGVVPMKSSAERLNDKIFINNGERVIIYQSAHLTITSPLKSTKNFKLTGDANSVVEWCDQSNTKILIVSYDSDHLSRHTLFQPSYEKFFLDNVFPLLDEDCSLTRDFRPLEGQPFIKPSDDYLLFMKKKGEDEFWDKFDIHVEYVRNRDGFWELNTIEKKGHKLLAAEKGLGNDERFAFLKKMRKRGFINIQGDELYEDEYLRIYNRNWRIKDATIDKSTWCYKPELDVVFKMDLEERDSTITVQYISPVIWDILNKHCDIPKRITLYYYPENADKYWDRIQYIFFQPKKSIPRAEECKLEYAKQLKTSIGPLQFKALKEKFESNPYYMWECDKGDKGIFCDLPGGKYINAIYENDVETIKKLDSRAYREATAIARAFDTKTGLNIIGLGLAQHIREMSLLLTVANQYMYHYQFNCESCLGPGAKKITYSHTQDTIRFNNMYGIEVGRLEGWTATTSYKVNKEFLPLLKRLGSFSDGHDYEPQVKRLGARGLERTCQDIKVLQTLFKCNSPEVKRFEKNLIDLTWKAIMKGTKASKN